MNNIRRRPQYQGMRTNNNQNNNNQNRNNSGRNNQNRNNNNGRQNNSTRHDGEESVSPWLRKHAQTNREKYTNMGRDAQLSGDRVLAEYYYQHADHYQRILDLAAKQYSDNNNGEQQPMDNQSVDAQNEGGNAEENSNQNQNSHQNQGQNQGQNQHNNQQQPRQHNHRQQRNFQPRQHNNQRFQNAENNAGTENSSGAEQPVNHENTQPQMRNPQPENVAPIVQHFEAPTPAEMPVLEPRASGNLPRTPRINRSNITDNSEAQSDGAKLEAVLPAPKRNYVRRRPLSPVEAGDNVGESSAQPVVNE